MKKVICIKQESYCAYTGKKLKPELVVGNTYTVISTLELPGKGIYYQLNECELLSRFNIKLFAELDTDLDETTLVNEEFEEKYCVPVNSEPCV